VRFKHVLLIFRTGGRDFDRFSRDDELLSNKVLWKKYINLLMFYWQSIEKIDPKTPHRCVFLSE